MPDIKAKTNIAVVGDRDSVLLFKAVGVAVYLEGDALSASRRIAELERADCQVIFVTEGLYKDCSETIQKYMDRAYPAIIPIPESQGSSGFAMAQIKANVEKAIGTDILFTEG